MVRVSVEQVYAKILTSNSPNGQAHSQISKQYR